MPDGSSRPRGYGPYDQLDARELGLYVRRRRADAVAWAEAHGLGRRSGNGPLLYRVSEVAAAMTRDGAPTEEPPSFEEPIALSDVRPYKGGPRKRRW